MGIFAAAIWHMEATAMNSKTRCLLVILGVFTVVNAAVLLTGTGLSARRDVWEQTELPEKWKERVFKMISEHRRQEAITTLRNYLRHAPDDGNMRRLLGKVLFESGRYDEARDAYYAALLNDPGDFVARNNMGVVLMKQGHAEDALREFKEAFDASGQEIFIAANLLCWYKNSGDTAGAGNIWNSVRDGVRGGEVMVPDDALMLASAEMIEKLQKNGSVEKKAAARP